MKTKLPVDPQNPRTIWGARTEDNGSNFPERRRRVALATPAASPPRKRIDQPVAAVEPERQPDQTVGGTEKIEYNGHTLRVEPHRNGWKVAIFPTGSPFALHRAPYTTEFSHRDNVIAEAKSIIDGVSAKTTAPEPATEPADVAESPEFDFDAYLAELRRPLADLMQQVKQGWGKIVAAVKRAYFSIDSH
jgi:hypothetical protein